jgi:hypothetical protein
LGVAIVGSVFSSVYAARLVDALVGSPVPPDAIEVAQDSVGAAVQVAVQAGEVAGPEAGAFVQDAVASSFVEGFHAGSWVSAGVVAVGSVIAWRFLPSRALAAHAGAPEPDPVASTT